MNYIKVPIQSDKIFRQLESIKQNDLKSHHNQYAISLEMYKTKQEGFRYFQLFIVLVSITLLFCFFHIATLIIVCILNAAVLELTPTADPPPQQSFRTPTEPSEDLFSIARNKLLPRSIPSTRQSNQFKSLVTKSNLLKGKVELQEHFNGQLTINNKLSSYNFATVRTNRKSFSYGTVFIIDNPRVTCKSIIVQKGKSNAIPQHLKGYSMTNTKAINPSFAKQYKIYSSNKEEGIELINEQFIKSLIHLHKNVHWNLKWTQMGNKIIIAVPKLLVHKPSNLVQHDKNKIERYLKELKTNFNECLHVVQNLRQQIQMIPKKTKKDLTFKQTEEVQKDMEKDFYQHLIL